MKDHLIFDTTDAVSIADSDSVGAFVRASDGTLITHTTDGGLERLDVNWRPLDYLTDNVAIKQGGNTMVVNADGSINVQADISVVSGSDKAEDAPHVSGDIGTYVLAVRQDVLATSTSADGDYGSFKTNSVGALYVALDPTSTVTVNDAALANIAIMATSNPLGVANTPENVVASPLANRKYLWIYNFDNTKVFIGQSGVTAANGFPISPGSVLELRAGAAVDIEFVGQSGKTPEIRTLELS